MLGLAVAVMPAAANDVRVEHKVVEAPEEYSSLAYRWVDVLQEVAGRDVGRYDARPTVLSRSMAIVTTAMYDAWAVYDDTALGTVYGAALKRPMEEHTQENQEAAISFAAYRTLIDQYPEDTEYALEALKGFGYSLEGAIPNRNTPAGIGLYVAEAILEQRHQDGANQLGNEPGSDGSPYSDYTQYNPANTPERIYHPDRWQPIPFIGEDGEVFAPGFITPHWYRVRPFALASSDQFRAPEPPRIGSEQLVVEINEVRDFNASLTPEMKAIAEFMRDGPRSTGQSGHWLRFAQDVSRRDRYDLEQDVKLFFVVGNAAMDAFIASWDSKRYWDTSRPWTLVRYYFGDERIEGWGGPGEGTVEMLGDEWFPYSPYSFVSPPFPAYPSGHSTVSAASAEVLRLFTASDEFGASITWTPGQITEPDNVYEDLELFLPTFTDTAEMAGISRLYGGFHIRADNTEGLAQGRRVAHVVFDKASALFEGRSF